MLPLFGTGGGSGMWDVGCGMWDVGCGMWDVGSDLGFRIQDNVRRSQVELCITSPFAQAAAFLGGASPPSRTSLDKWADPPELPSCCFCITMYGSINGA